MNARTVLVQRFRELFCRPPQCCYTECLVMEDTILSCVSDDWPVGATQHKRRWRRKCFLWIQAKSLKGRLSFHCSDTESLTSNCASFSRSSCSADPPPSCDEQAPIFYFLRVQWRSREHLFTLVTGIFPETLSLAVLMSVSGTSWGPLGRAIRRKALPVPGT